MVIKIAYVNGVIAKYSDFSNWDKLAKNKIKVIYCYNNNLTSLPEKYKLSLIIYI